MGRGIARPCQEASKQMYLSIGRCRHLRDFDPSRHSPGDENNVFSEHVGKIRVCHGNDFVKGSNALRRHPNPFDCIRRGSSRRFSQILQHRRQVFLSEKKRCDGDEKLVSSSGIQEYSLRSPVGSSGIQEYSLGSSFTLQTDLFYCVGVTPYICRIVSFKTCRTIVVASLNAVSRSVTFLSCLPPLSGHGFGFPLVCHPVGCVSQ